MRKTTQIPALLIFAVVLTALTGCTTMDRMYRGSTRMTNPDKMKLQTNVKWLTPPTSMGLTPVAPEKRTVYLRYKNSSGSNMPDMRADIEQSLQQAGYSVTRDPTEAKYTMTVDCRFFGVNREKDAGGTLLTGGILGGILGAVAGHNIGDGYTGEGAAGGAIAGAAAANVLANRNKMVELDLVFDLRVGERIKGGVKTQKAVDTSSRVSQRTSSGGERGSSGTRSTSTQKFERKADFVYYKNRIVASARKMALRPEEAQPVLRDRIVKAVSNVLP